MERKRGDEMWENNPSHLEIKNNQGNQNMVRVRFLQKEKNEIFWIFFQFFSREIFFFQIFSFSPFKIVFCKMQVIPTYSSIINVIDIYY